MGYVAECLSVLSSSLDLCLEHLGIKKSLQLHCLGDISLQLHLSLHEGLVWLQLSTSDQHEIRVLEVDLHLNALLLVMVDASRIRLKIINPLFYSFFLP